MTGRLPIFVLGGSDRKPGPVPRGVAAKDMITGYKGAARLPWGRCLAADLVERLKQCGRFERPVLVGPRRIYRGQVDCEIVDAEGDLPVTLECIRTLVRERLQPAQAVALVACDILPQPDELHRLLETCYDGNQDCVFWGQLVEATPAVMGASHWKPAYRFRSANADRAIQIYPGHLVIVQPQALRIRLINHLLQLAYRYRNRDIHTRQIPMLARGLGRLIREDIRSLISGKLPRLSISVPYYALTAYYRYRRGQLTVRDFEHRVGQVFVHRNFQRRNRGRPVVFDVTPILSLAKDIDTKSELMEVAFSG